MRSSEVLLFSAIFFSLVHLAAWRGSVKFKWNEYGSRLAGGVPGQLLVIMFK